MRTLGDLAAEYLDAQTEALLAGEDRLRRGEPEVHDVRVAARRYRSTLRTYADLFDGDSARALEGELRWYARILGDVRDAQVLRKRLHEATEQLDPSLVVGPVAQRIDDELAAATDRATERLCHELDAPRYIALRVQLRQWVEQPPWTPLNTRRAKEVKSYVQLERERLRKKLRKAERAASTDAARVHAARKAAKRCRYAIELARPALDNKRAKRLSRRVQLIQERLGEFQDAVVAGETLLRVRGNAEAAGEDGFTYGVLYANEQQRAADARKAVRRGSI